MPFAIREVVEPQERSSACVAITRTIPEWFGQPASNAMYGRQIADKDAFGAFLADDPVGLIALDYHFDQTAEVWWLGVRREAHRQGIGRALLARARDRARERQRRYLVLKTLSPASPDEGYARTRKFYLREGFVPLVDLDGADPANPMMWMLQTL